MRFLLVDDDANDRDLMVYAIGDNHAIEVASSCGEALSKIERSERTHGQFDAILLDLGLPDSDGEETFRRVYTRCKPTPIVVFSGHEDVKIARTLMAHGASNYVVKTPQLRSEVVVFHLEQAAIAARSSSAAEIEIRTATRIAQEEADAMETMVKSLPPPGLAPNLEGQVAQVEGLVRTLMSNQAALVRMVAAGAIQDVIQDRKLEKQDEAISTARRQALSAEEAAARLGVEVQKVGTEVQKLSEVSAKNKAKLAAAGGSIVTLIIAIVEALRALGVLR